jgi:hypothetical protein
LTVVVERKCATADREAGRIAGRAHGVVTHRELRAASLSEGQIRQRLLTGALLRQHPGVYRVGHSAPSVEADYMAAVKACGEGAMLSGLAAAYLHGLLRGRSGAPRPEVTAPKRRRVKGISTRRARNLDPRDRTSLNRIPATTVARTLVDIAPLLSLDDLARACHEADIKHGTKPGDIEAVLDRRPNSPRAAKLRRVLHGDIHVTLSTLERRFLQLLREHDLPLPLTNRPAGTKRVDCRWPERRLTVELDSFRYHNTRHSWEQDRRREREAHARGDQFRRYTYADVLEHPDAMLRELEALLKR